MQPYPVYIYFADNFQTLYEKNLEKELLELYNNHYIIHKVEWTKMKLEFKQQTENIDTSSEQYSQLHQEHNKKLNHLKTEFKRKLEQEKEHYKEYGIPVCGVFKRGAKLKRFLAKNKQYSNEITKL